MCQLEERRNWFPLEYRLSAGKSFPQNNENVVYQKLQHLDDVISIVLVRLPFLKMKEF